jgi:hypothetical protein
LFWHCYSYFICVFIQDKAEDLQAIDSCEYIWEAGVGFAHSPPRYPALDSNRTELLKLLLTCFSETMYQPPVGKWHIPVVLVILVLIVILFVTFREQRLLYHSDIYLPWTVWALCDKGAQVLGDQILHICGPSVWNFLHVAYLVPKILKCVLDFLKIYAPLSCAIWGYHSGEYWYDILGYHVTF